MRLCWAAAALNALSLQPAEGAREEGEEGRVVTALFRCVQLSDEGLGGHDTDCAKSAGRR